ncbi:PLAC8-like protein 1 [Gopherus evgoodei]|uniref:PLAC8 like 1 n=2 Tax=Gopherus TaxID=38771 RepID=A0A8C4W4C4_9SAUR|nr:PLAC8-like protein 1 [Gopherus evgoodei]XP_030429265.1 PLAC8-like protein 1 [Gopherus evgoodei]XP_030429266.1 PLAC8-like protein 1 [Gopherus evgoodei]XP_030429267.1 PLAC8-like protein 1 [Gopherus evgoodei]XP_030429268.1 PLAC8-like protein 1 [Gopherus evgoodei]
MNQLGSRCFSVTEEASLPEIQAPLILSLITPEDGTFFLSALRNKKPTEPVTTQPTRGVGMSTVATVVRTGGDWTTGLFGICSDKSVCVCGALCSPCLECSLARHYGECLCFPLLPGSTLAMRVGAREKYKIRGTLCEDWMAVHCCWPFAVCQVARELKRRATTQIYEINTAPTAKDTLV